MTNSWSGTQGDSASSSDETSSANGDSLFSMFSGPDLVAAVKQRRWAKQTEIIPLAKILFFLILWVATQRKPSQLDKAIQTSVKHWRYDQHMVYLTLMPGMPKLSSICSCCLKQTSVCANSQFLAEIQHVYMLSLLQDIIHFGWRFFPNYWGLRDRLWISVLSCVLPGSSVPSLTWCALMPASSRSLPSAGTLWH